MHSAPRQAFRLFPAGSRGETQQRDRIGMVVRTGLALFQQSSDLIQGQKRQFDLIRLDLPDLAQRVSLCQEPRRISSEKTADK